MSGCLHGAHLAHLARFDLPHLEPGLPAEGQLPLAEPPRRQLREVLDAPLVCRRLPRLLRLDLGGVLSRERTELELPPLRLVKCRGPGSGGRVQGKGKGRGRGQRYGQGQGKGQG